GVARSPQAGGTARLADLGAGGQEDLFQALAVEFFRFQPGRDFTGRGNHEGIDANEMAFEDLGGGTEVGHLATRARAYISANELFTFNLGNRSAVIRTVRFGDHRFHFGDVINLFKAKAGPSITFHYL